MFKKEIKSINGELESKGLRKILKRSKWSSGKLEILEEVFMHCLQAYIGSNNILSQFRIC